MLKTLIQKWSRWERQIGKLAKNGANSWHPKDGPSSFGFNVENTRGHVCMDEESPRSHGHPPPMVGKGKTNLVIRPLFREVMQRAWTRDGPTFFDGGDPEGYLKTFLDMGTQTREMLLRNSLEALALGKVDYDGAISLISRLFAIHLEGVEETRRLEELRIARQEGVV